MGIFNDYINSINWEELKKQTYEKELNNPNNYSFWYPKVKDCGIPMVTSYCYTIPYNIWEYFRSSYENLSQRNICLSWIKSIIDNNNELDKNTMYNIKNGCFSNKFNADDCNVYYDDIPEKFLNIQYASYELETHGMTELVIRNYLPFNDHTIPTIYHGLPLRPEFRVFVDFDNNEILYIVNYWDYDYCNKGMYNITDKIVFDYMKEELEQKFNQHKKTVYDLVHDKLLQHNKNNPDKLTGKWSVDIMLWADTTYYLIDMALAQQSAYWDNNRKDEI